MKIALRSQALAFLVKCGLLPADTLLFYDKEAFRWFSGFGEFAHVLYSLVRSAKPETIVEVGSAYGYSTCYIAAALQRNGLGMLYSIDPHEPTQWNDGDPMVDTFMIVQERLKNSGFRSTFSRSGSTRSKQLPGGTSLSTCFCSTARTPTKT